MSVFSHGKRLPAANTISQGDRYQCTGFCLVAMGTQGLDDVMYIQVRPHVRSINMCTYRQCVGKYTSFILCCGIYKYYSGLGNTSLQCFSATRDVECLYNLAV